MSINETDGVVIIVQRKLISPIVKYFLAEIAMYFLKNLMHILLKNI